jgi:hypothetical protein
MLMELLAGASAAAFFPVLGYVWLGAGAVWLIPTICILLIAACAAGWMEPSGRRVWIHPLVIMSPELASLVCGLLICPAIMGPKGEECAWLLVFLVLAMLCVPVLMGLSYIAFYIGRWARRPIVAGNSGEDVRSVSP